MNKELSKIIYQILEKKNKNVRDLNSNKKLRKDLGFDSLDLAELTAKIEDKFGIDIFENKIVETTEEIEEMIEEK